MSKKRTPTVKPRRELSWKPRRRGNVYCAPACGRGCTMEEYLDAQRKGAALAKRLGDGWSGHVTENLGWHYRAVSKCGRLYVTETEHQYWAFLGGGQYCAAGNTPYAAVRTAVAQAQAAAKAILELIKGLTP